MIAIVQKLLSEVNGMKVALAALSIILTRRRRSSLGKAFIAFRERQVEKDEVKLRGDLPLSTSHFASYDLILVFSFQCLRLLWG